MTIMISDPDTTDGSVSVFHDGALVARVDPNGFVRAALTGAALDALTIVNVLSDKRRRDWEAMQEANPRPPLGDAPDFAVTPAPDPVHEDRPAFAVYKLDGDGAPEPGESPTYTREQHERPEAWHTRLVRLAREAEEAREAENIAADSLESAREAHRDARAKADAAYAVFSEARGLSAILAAGGGK